MRIVIESRGARAGEVAVILAAADKAFARFARDRLGTARPTLTVEAVQPGSVEIVLGALDAYEKINTAAAILAPFAAHLGQVFHLLQAGGAQQVSATDKKLVRSIVEPVANDHAQQINIVNNGKIEITVHPGNAPDVLESLTSTVAVRAPLAPPPTERGLSPSQAQRLEGSGLEGTAIDVNGTWYARLLDGQGVLVPARGSTGGLVHNRSYRFRGRPITGFRGEVIGIELSGADPLGRMG